MLALSGIYTAAYGFDGYMDEVVYRNSPVDYLSGMSADHPFIEEYRRHRGIICVGQGPWEVPETTRRIAELNAEKKHGPVGGLLGGMIAPTTGTGGISRWPTSFPIC